MKAETIFTAINGMAIIGWLLLIFLPRWKWTRGLIISGGLSLLLAALYLAIVVATFGQAEGGFGSLAEVGQLFRQDWVLLAGWAHYLAFDLFVGSWEVSDAQRLKLSHLLVVPCLILTFLLGPVGFLLYHLLSFNARRKENQ